MAITLLRVNRYTYINGIWHLDTLIVDQGHRLLFTAIIEIRQSRGHELVDRLVYVEANQILLAVSCYYRSGTGGFALLLRPLGGLLSTRVCLSAEKRKVKKA